LTKLKQVVLNAILFPIYAIKTFVLNHIDDIFYIIILTNSPANFYSFGLFN